MRQQIDPLHGHCGDESMECTIPMPVRVMPRELTDFTSAGFAEERWFQLTADQVAQLASGRLYVQGHNLGYRDGHMVGDQLVKDGKASVILGDCPAVPLVNDDARIQLFEPEVHYEGIGGGFRTVRMHVDLSATSCLQEGWNRIAFQFNGTDGTSSGFRILDFNLQAGGVDVLPPEAFAWDDNSMWGPPSYDARDQVAGRRLFTARRSLISSPIDPTVLVAACSDCHANWGQDLKYFGYSNESIVNRSVFHGLTPEEGEQIASWIRALPVPQHGNPWDPPYQPGPGLDTRADAAARWSAGAGLDAVLDDEASHASEIMDLIFPLGWRETQSPSCASCAGKGWTPEPSTCARSPSPSSFPTGTPGCPRCTRWICGGTCTSSAQTTDPGPRCRPHVSARRLRRARTWLCVRTSRTASLLPRCRL